MKLINALFIAAVVVFSVLPQTQTQGSAISTFLFPRDGNTALFSCASIVRLFHEAENEREDFQVTPSAPFLESHNLSSGQSSANQGTGTYRPTTWALAAAHDAWVVHRDMKPLNLLIGKIQNPKASGFDLNLLYDGNGSSTRESAIAGAPAFTNSTNSTNSKPIFNSQNFNRRTDLGSLGVVLYRMLCEQLNFQNIVRITLMAVPTRDLPSPRFNSDKLPRDFETIFRKAMSEDRNMRFAITNYSANDLTQLSNSEPLVSRPANRFEQFWGWCERNPAIAISKTAFVALLLMMAVGSAIASLSLSVACNEAEEQRELALKAFDSLLDEVQVKFLKNTTLNEDEAVKTMLDVSVRGLRKINERTDNAQRLKISSVAANILFGRISCKKIESTK